MVGRQNFSFFFSIASADILERKKYFSSVRKEEKPGIVLIQSIYSRCNKIEEHS